MTDSSGKEAVIPPVLIFSQVDLAVFDDVAVAERSLEAIDVRNGEYDGAFDASGHPLVLTVSIERFVRWLPVTIERVRIERAQTDDALAPMLARRIKAFLVACNVDNETIEDRELKDLVTLARNHARTT